MKNILIASLSLLFMASLTACNKSDPAPEPEVDPVIPETMFNRMIEVRNFGEDLSDGAAPDSDQEPIYYSLEENKPVAVSYRRTNRWDISFAGIYRSYLGGNSGRGGGVSPNYGAGGPGVGGIMIVEKSFDEVVDIPDDNVFKTERNVISTDDNGDMGNGIGWYLYDFGGTRVRDGAYDNAHIAYALDKPLEITLPNGGKKTVQPRTVIVRTARGNYAKIRMRSIYKNKLERDSWKRNDDKPYFSFDYVLAKKGSAKFEID
ncbi:HmuY family protein [Sphingobacterium gobiense]|nr:HmuY family protein [Sphingobacterium gobiense]